MTLPHLTSVLGRLGYWFFGCALSWSAFTIWRKRRKKLRLKWIPCEHNLRKFRDQGYMALERWPVLFVICAVTILALAAVRSPLPLTEEHYNVKVMKKVGVNKWWMIREDQPQQFQAFLYEGCDDFPNEKVIWAGYIAKKIRYQEMGQCKSIRRKDLGFFWDRDDNFNVKEIR